MASLKQLVARCHPSAMMRRMLKYSGDISEGSKRKILAKRTILGRQVIFYENGSRMVDDLTENEQHNSEILKLAHASLLMNDAVGDKSQCYVDARKNPVEVVIWNTPAETFIKRAKKSIKNGIIPIDFVLDQPLREIRHERNVKFFGK